MLLRCPMKTVLASYWTVSNLNNSILHYLYDYFLYLLFLHKLDHEYISCLSSDYEEACEALNKAHGSQSDSELLTTLCQFHETLSKIKLEATWANALNPEVFQYL